MSSPDPPPNEAAPPPPVWVEEPAGDAAPLLYSSPHSGRRYPPGFRPVVPVEALTGFEDRFVDDLIASAPRHGIRLVAALFPRAFVDPNRGEDDLDAHVVEDGWTGPLAPTPQAGRGIGLVFRTLPTGEAIYDRPLTHAELRDRIEGYWRPFHAALDRALAESAAGGPVWHVDWHSMRPVGDALAPDPGARRPDFVVSDRDGTSAEPALTEAAVEILRALGHSVAVNAPFRGGYIVARHGRPAEGRHALQIEINRGLYLDMESLARGPGFDALAATLDRFSRRLARAARARLGAV